jgi:hypothetical protein
MLATDCSLVNICGAMISTVYDYVISIAEKKQTGSLVTRNLTDLVKKEHFILDSEYLTTVLGQHYAFYFRSFAFRPLFYAVDLLSGELRS